jgi:acetyl esterase/lipase
MVVLGLSLCALLAVGLVYRDRAGAATVTPTSTAATTTTTAPPVLTGTLRNVVYSQTPSGPLAMDITFPGRPGPHPVIVWVHGGGWMNGSKDAQPLPDYIAEQVTRRNFVAVSIDYRLAGWTADGTPVNAFPDAVDDVKTAIRFLKANASRYDLRADMVLLSGQSAGGHLAALAGTSSSLGALEPSGLSPVLAAVDDTVRAVIDVVGISDVGAWGNDNVSSWTSEPVAAFLGCPRWTSGPPDCSKASEAKASVAPYVSAASPPAFLAYGALDPLVPAATHGAPLASWWKAAIGDANVVYDLVPNQGHEVDGRGIDRAALDTFVDGVLAGRVN